MTTYVYDKSEPLPDFVHPEVLLRKAITINKENIASSSNTSVVVEQSSSQKSIQKSWYNNKQGDVLQQIATEPSLVSEVPDCTYCGAKKFEYEPPGFYCAFGEIHLLLTKMSRDLMLLYLGDSEEAAELRKCVTSYNNMFVFTSIGMHAGELSSRRHHTVYTFKVQGQMYHFINQTVPPKGEKPKNLQLYFFHTDHETVNRLSISTLSIATQATTIMSHYPLIPQTTVLQHWLYDREHQTVELRSENQLQQIRHVKNMNPMLKTFWIKAEPYIANTQQRLYVFTCPNCSEVSRAEIDMEINCLHCNMTMPKARPRSRFEVQLKDEPSMLNSHIDDKYADLIRGIIAEEMASMEAKNEQIDINLINQTLKGEYFCFRIKVSFLNLQEVQ
ncbi:hypothetical protein ACH5RR_012502 [Cinchona calisaya]|uniref:Replication factor A C-terminal domain-containing protein n=1 Tax=Cinchona calisaya TaxID=153742 RepID=A0ABD3AAB8_9GENT